MFSRGPTKICFHVQLYPQQVTDRNRCTRLRQCHLGLTAVMCSPTWKNYTSLMEYRIQPKRIKGSGAGDEYHVKCLSKSWDCLYMLGFLTAASSPMKWCVNDNSQPSKYLVCSPKCTLAEYKIYSESWIKIIRILLPSVTELCLAWKYPESRKYNSGHSCSTCHSLVIKEWKSCQRNSIQNSSAIL